VRVRVRVRCFLFFTHPTANTRTNKCYIDQPGPNDHVVLHPTASTVTSYAWVYTW
jgi:hypothetical protein